MERMLPHSSSAERAVLGAILRQPDVDVLEILQGPEDFYEDRPKS